jgi:hypothetical protein
MLLDMSSVWQIKSSSMSLSGIYTNQKKRRERPTVARVSVGSLSIVTHDPNSVLTMEHFLSQENDTRL